MLKCYSRRYDSGVTSNENPFHISRKRMKGRFYKQKILRLITSGCLNLLYHRRLCRRLLRLRLFRPVLRQIRLCPDPWLPSGVLRDGILRVLICVPLSLVIAA